jgi:hypothetical protein
MPSCRSSFNCSFGIYLHVVSACISSCRSCFCLEDLRRAESTKKFEGFRMPKVRNTPSLSSLPRNDYNIPGVERSTVQRVQAAWRFTFPLQHYINRRVGEELQQYSLPLHCFAIKKCNHRGSFLHCAFEQTLHRLRLASSNGKNHQNGQSAINC